MELRLIVEARGRPPREVAVDVEPAHLTSELVAALAGHLGLESGPGYLGLYCPRLGTWLDDRQEIASAGLRTGDRVQLWDRSAPVTGSAPDGPRAALVDLVVVGGPDAGRTISLAPGEHRVGSFRYASILLEDPILSKVHLTITVSPTGGVTVADLGSDSGTFVGARRIGGATPVEPGQLVVCGRSLLTFRRSGDAPARPAHAATQDRTGVVAFNRPPRVALTRPNGAFQLPAPPAKQGGNRLPVASGLAMMGMGAAMYFAMGRSPAMLVFVFISPLMIVGGFVDSAVGGGWSYRRKTKKYRAEMKRLEGRMAAAMTEVAGYLRAQAPDAATLVERARVVDSNLWERRPDGADWLLLRLGWSDRPSGISLSVKRGSEEEDEGEGRLRQEAVRLLDRHRTIPTAPMTVSLREAGVIGLSGDQDLVRATARCLCLQLAVLHSPDDLVLAAIVPETEREQWAWLGWLPHVESERSPLPGRRIASDRASAYSLVDGLLAVVAARRTGVPSSSEATVVLLLREGVALPRGSVSQLLQEGPGVGVHVIWVGAHGHALPGECGAVLEVEPGSLEPVLTLPGRGESSRGGGADGVSVQTATEAALALAPVRDVSSRAQAAGVPRRVQLLEVLGIRDDPASGIMQAWIRDRSSPATRDLAARLGMAADGAPFEASLRFDGPHALVGVMTGSGKSEFLQSLVAALASAYSPRTLNFLLVDYKGGAAFKDCVDLPHTVGFVTDLDGHLVNRALISLRAELRRREEILRQVGAKDLLDLEQRQPDRAPANLVIIVDEFGALATELPEFVEGMVDVAMRGRSLGIHLVLATQRPAGVINAKIRANTNLRISLRFSDEGESMDVVGTGDAARPGLPPGRAFARAGPGQVTEFQAGYVGGQTAVSSGVAPVVVRDVRFGSAVRPSGDGRQALVEGATDLQRLVAAAIETNGKLGLPPPVRPWLPTLPAVLPLETLPPAGRSPRGAPRASFGLVDDPTGQRQHPLEFGLDEDAGLLVFGTTGSGKTTLLRSLAASLAGSTSPEELHIYALDFASRGLKTLEALPHCGGVIGGDEPQRAVRLLQMLQSEAERRKSLLAQTGTTTIEEYLAARPAEPLPRLLVLLDSVSGFTTALETNFIAAAEALPQLVGDGRSLGMSFILSASRSTNVPVRLATHIGRRLILRMATEDEYSILGVPRSVYVGSNLPPGRGFTERGLEAQCAVLGPDASGSAQAAAVVRLGSELERQGHRPTAVPRVGVLPAEISRASLPAPATPLEAVIGVEDASLQPARVDLLAGHCLVTGPRGSGRTTALATFAASLAAGPQAPRLLLLAPRLPSALAALGVWTSTALGVDACAELVRTLAQAARGGEAGAAAGAAVLVIDDGEELMESMDDLEWIAERGRNQGFRVVAAVPNHVAQRAYSGWLIHVVRDRQGLLLDPDPMSDGNIFSVRLPSRQRGIWPPGRGHLVCRGSVELVQVAGD